MLVQQVILYRTSFIDPVDCSLLNNISKSLWHKNTHRIIGNDNRLRYNSLKSCSLFRKPFMLKLKGDNHQNEIFLDPNMKVFVGWSNVRGHWCESESRFPAGGVFKESWQSWLTNSSPVVCYSQADLSNLTLKSSTQKTFATSGYCYVF